MGVDENGEAVTDPDKVVSLSTFGGPKGYGLSIVVDVFSGLLAGAAFGPHIAKCTAALIKKESWGIMFVRSIRPFTDWDTFLGQMDAMLDELRQSPPVAGVERVYVPGEIEHRMKKEIRYTEYQSLGACMNS